MKKFFKIIIFSVLTLLLMCCFSGVVFAEISEGHFDFYYDGFQIVNNDWYFESESGTLTIVSLSSGYNETGTGQQSYVGSWYAHKNDIRRVVLVGGFSKISNNAFNGYPNLCEIEITEGVSQIDNNAFDNCPSLRSIYIGTGVKRDYTADISGIAHVTDSILKGTSIKNVILSPNVASISESAFPADLSAIYGAKNTLAESFANSHSISFKDISDAFAVNVFIDGKLYDADMYFSDEKFNNIFFEHAGKVYTVFEDEKCNTPYDVSRVISSPLDLYAKPILSFEGISVRVADYTGLRSVYRFENIDFGANFKIKSVGAIVGCHEYADKDFRLTVNKSIKAQLYEDGALVGRYLSTPKGTTERFAVSVVDFESSEEEFAYRALKNIVYCGYISVYDEISELTYTYYTDAVGTTLRGASEQYLNRFSNIDKKQAAFVRETIINTDSYSEEVRYDKDMLTDVITEVYVRDDMLLVGEQVDYGKMPHDVLDPYYEKVGAYPSILGVDLGCYGMSLTSSPYGYRDSFIRELIDYSREGGIITVSSHFNNPAGSDGDACRGDLGMEDAWRDIITEGTELNAKFKKELDVDAEFLRILGNNSVPVLWRPLHEMNGNWFWWCTVQYGNQKLPASCFQELWKYVYNYYENELGLTNLLWVYSPNNGNVDASYCYPGDDYVDMGGIDWYTSGDYNISTSYKNVMSHGMPTALTEYGSNGMLDSIETYDSIMQMYDDGMKLVYILTWTYGSKQDFRNAGRVEELMLKYNVLSCDEVYEMFASRVALGKLSEDIFYRVSKENTKGKYKLTFFGEGESLPNVNENYSWSRFAEDITTVEFFDNISNISGDTLSGLDSLNNLIIHNEKAAIDGNSFSLFDIKNICGYNDSTAFDFAESFGISFSDINYILPLAKGYLYEEWNGSVVVSTYWYYAKSEKTLYLVSDKSGWNESGALHYATDGIGWSAYKDEIEKIVIGYGLLKVSGSAFIDHKNLRTVELSTDISQIDGNAFNGCTSLDTVYVAGNSPKKGTADLHNIGNISASVGAFLGCAFDTVILGGQINDINAGIFSDDAVKTVITTSTSDVASKIGADYAYGYVSGSTVWSVLGDTLYVCASDFPSAVDEWKSLSKNIKKIVFEGESDVRVLGTGVFDIFQNLETVTFFSRSPKSAKELCFGSNSITVYYQKGDPTFTTPEWNGYKCAELE